jgi:glycosyltransferase involved in cell wall biosynthesis
MKFTLVSTVFNEAKRLQITINELSNQTVQPSEIIITDAGSNDGTYEMLMEWKRKSAVPIIIFQKPRCNVAEGRNIAIKAATHDIIISTDFGCRFHPGWLESIIAPFEDKKVLVVGGSYIVKEDEQVSLPAKAAYLLANGYKPNMDSPLFIPSSRSIGYRKPVFDHVGGYCEWLTLAADDLVFGFEMRSKGYEIYKVDKPYVFWGRHEKTKGFVKEAYRYGLGDGEANVNFNRFINNVLQLALYGVNLITLLAVAFFKLPIIYFYCVLGIDLIVFTKIYSFYAHYTLRWIKTRTPKYNLKVFLFGFYLKECINLSYIKGYIKGYFFSTPYQKEQTKLLQKRLQGAN